MSSGLYFDISRHKAAESQAKSADHGSPLPRTMPILKAKDAQAEDGHTGNSVRTIPQMKASSNKVGVGIGIAIAVAFGLAAVKDR